MGGTKVDAPPPRDVYSETQGNLEAQIKLAPDLFKSEAKFRPLYNALELQTFEDSMLGTTEQKHYEQAGYYDRGGRYLGNPTEGEKIGNNSKFKGATYQDADSYGVARQRGLLDIYEQDIYPSLSRVEAADRQSRIQGELGAIQQYGQDITDGMRQMAGTDELIAEQNRQALGDLKLGATLDPSLRRELTQTVRQGQAARGMGYGMNDLIQESAFTAQQAEQLRRQRQAYASASINQSTATAADPFMAILGRPSQTLGLAPSFGAQGMAVGQTAAPRLFNPESQYASQLHTQNSNLAFEANKASAEANAALMGGIIGGVGQLGGAGIGKYCWVAREVYGADDYRWVKFRNWLLNDGPRWLVNIYGHYGEQFAAYIRTRPRIKAFVRSLMDMVVKG
jgi:hypothetical protein